MPKHENIEDYVKFSTYGPNMPWVDNRLPKILKMATSFYFRFAIPDDNMRAKMDRPGLMGLGLRLMNRLSDWRVRNRRYGFPVEYKIARFTKDVLIARFGMFRRLREVM
ncbi:MAG: hypothetical protein M5R36_28100 [Deltaproteobacteria bacterium]|nr:hypothetical protein [Deltaproteobacteria bacterium]